MTSGEALVEQVRALLTDLPEEVRNAGDATTSMWIEHIFDQVLCWIGWEVFSADASRPFFQRQNDLVTKWGGPNADNVYRHARIDSGHRYRISGHMHSCDLFLVAFRAGFMHSATWGTLATATSFELGLERGQPFSFTIGGPDDDVVLPDGAIMASIREYYLDWTPEEPATFVVECLDPSPPARVTDDVLSERLERAGEELHRAVLGWRAYLLEHASLGESNRFPAEPERPAKGLPMADYGFCFWDLAPGEALVVTTQVPQARYWGIQLYEMGTYELVDPYGAISSRNERQTTCDSNGTVQWVLAAEDPGCPNWLDTAGRGTGLCTVRSFWPANDHRLDLSTRVVPVDQLRSVLAPGTLEVTPEQRREELAQRQAHLRWRFRT